MAELKTSTSVENCANSLRRSILDGTIAPETRLPPERRLAEQFGVNRVTVRSALARLAESGLLSVRQGSGYLVRDFHKHGGPDLLLPIADLAAEQGSLPEVVADLLMVRRQLASGLLERLCSSMTKARRERIEEAVDAFELVVEQGGNTESLAEADLGILSSLLVASGSAVLALSLNPINAVLNSLPELREAIYQHPNENLAAWRGLVHWLAQPTRSAIEGIITELKLRDERAVAEIDATVRWDRMART
jgi:GntR family transcriptional regulator, transcriptional repressor for pyruvate dehydrogenase complex